MNGASKQKMVRAGSRWAVEFKSLLAEIDFYGDDLNYLKYLSANPLIYTSIEIVHKNLNEEVVYGNRLRVLVK